MTWKTKKNGYKVYGNTGKYVHRHVAERKLGRSLRPGEVVHHINRNKMDNRRSNLWVFGDQENHDRVHREDKRRFGRW